jgi:hypothetical protein
MAENILVGRKFPSLTQLGEKNCMYLSIVREIVSWSRLRGSYWRNFSALFVVLLREESQKGRSSAGNGINMYA